MITEIQEIKNSRIKNNKAEVVFIASIALISLIYLLAQSIPSLLRIIGTVGITAIAFVSLNITIRTTRKTYSSPIWRIFIALTSAILLYFIGEVTWDAYSWIISVDVPYPSFADVAWLAGYFPQAYAYLILLRLSSISLSFRTKFIWFVASGLIFLALAYTLITPLLSLEEGVDALFFNLAYPIGDIFLFLLALTLIIFIRKTWLSLIWLPLAASSLIDFFADLSFSFVEARGAYFEGHPVDMLFTFSYVLFAYGVYKAGDCMITLKTYFSKNFTKFTPKMSMHDAFSESLKLTHEELLGKRLLLEFDPRSNYEDDAEDLVHEALSYGESVIVFTQKGSNIHQRLAGQHHVHLILLVEGFITPKHTRKDELLIFGRDIWMIVETLKNMVRFEKICLIYDNLTNMILSIGFQGAYSFIRFVAELMEGSKSISLFLLNPQAHKTTIVSFVEGQFSDHLIHDQKGLRAVKLIAPKVR
ncbi:MAG: hypothetical protein H3Z51_14360 [archaeon]|nr:hypothetical protein [archaeon]